MAAKNPTQANLSHFAPQIIFYSGQQLNYARNLLRETGLSIQDIAEQLGYKDAYIFSKQYRKQFGKPPSQDRDETP